MNFGRTEKFQPLLSTAILVAFLVFVLVVQACIDDKSPSSDHVTLFDPDSLRVLSTSQEGESLIATKTKGAILLNYGGTYNRTGEVRIYDGKNNLVYGDKELELIAGNITKLNFENTDSDTYQLFVFFDNGEFLVSTVEVPEN